MRVTGSRRAIIGHAQADFKLLYPDSMTIKEKLAKIATTIYGAKGVEYSPEAEEQIARYTALGFGSLPVCVAKTHLSLSADAKVKGVPTGFMLPVREVRASVGKAAARPALPVPLLSSLLPCLDVSHGTCRSCLSRL